MRELLLLLLSYGGKLKERLLRIVARVQLAVIFAVKEFVAMIVYGPKDGSDPFEVQWGGENYGLPNMFALSRGLSVPIVFSAWATVFRMIKYFWNKHKSKHR